ncbi:MAG: hypothetical protein K0Q68_1953 [Moraxellaceae bacterium]|jgi:hypothetical protein|nr:hypothetical protein [Moraxellaceae bacterium]
MRFIRQLIRLVFTIALLIVCLYTVNSLVIAAFIANGTLTPGNPMWVDVDTPTILEALTAAGLGAVMTALFAYGRHKLSVSAQKYQDHTS